MSQVALTTDLFGPNAPVLCGYIVRLGLRLLSAVRPALCWGGLGALVGLCECQPGSGNAVALFSFMLAGVIVFTPLGVVLYFVLGARGRDALCGGVLGAMVTVIAGGIGAMPDVSVGVVITMGALFASTGAVVVRATHRLMSSVWLRLAVPTRL